MDRGRLVCLVGIPHFGTIAQNNYRIDLALIAGRWHKLCWSLSSSKDTGPAIERNRSNGANDTDNLDNLQNLCLCCLMPSIRYGMKENEWTCSDATPFLAANRRRFARTETRRHQLSLSDC